jgi:hypothetical protein
MAFCSRKQTFTTNKRLNTTVSKLWGVPAERLYGKHTRNCPCASLRVTSPVFVRTRSEG